MKKMYSKICLSVMAVALCVGMSSLTASAANSPKVTSATMKTTTGGDFVKGVSKAKISFKISGESSDVTLKIKNEDDKVVLTKEVKGCKTGKTYTFNWTGKKANGKYATEGAYYTTVSAGDSSKKTKKLDFITKSDFSGGDGSKSKPYKVSSVKEFKSIYKHNKRHFVQTKDLNFNNATFNPLFTADDPFQGTYDGKNKTIKNITLTSKVDDIGIFRAVGNKGVVKNMKVSDCIMSGNNRVAVIVGHNFGTVSKCTVNACTVSGENFAAAIVGINTNGKIQNCKSTKNSISTAQYGAAAICGSNETGIIKSCSTKNDLVNAASDWAGGIAAMSDGSITDCKMTTSTIQGRGMVGGIVGTNGSIVSKCTVNDSKNTISGGRLVGGIVGENKGTVNNCNYNGLLNQIGE